MPFSLSYATPESSVYECIYSILMWSVFLHLVSIRPSVSILRSLAEFCRCPHSGKRGAVVSFVAREIYPQSCRVTALLMASGMSSRMVLSSRRSHSDPRWNKISTDEWASSNFVEE